VGLGFDDGGKCSALLYRKGYEERKEGRGRKVFSNLYFKRCSLIHGSILSGSGVAIVRMRCEWMRSTSKNRGCFCDRCENPLENRKSKMFHKGM
jgi:hypothetical protein